MRCLSNVPDLGKCFTNGTHVYSAPTAAASVQATLYRANNAVRTFGSAICGKTDCSSGRKNTHVPG